MHALRTSHLKSTSRILKYLKGTPKKIWMKNNNSNDICGYSNINWSSSFYQKLTTEFYIFINEI
jgi:hypothetical protein